MERNPISESTKPLRIMMVAGEVSGDMHAADLLRDMKAIRPDVEAFGIGGDAMQKQGLKLSYHTRDMAVMGISEVLQRIGFFRRALKEMTELAATERPHVLVTVDYPGFNLRLARKVHALGIRTVQYISPKVWAWNARRVPKIAAAFDRLITIFPFEQDYYQNTGLDLVYVGNPLVDAAQRQYATDPSDLPWGGPPKLALLPGSREHEISRLLPCFIETINRIKQRFPQCSAIIPAPNNDIGERVKRALLRIDQTAAKSIPVVTGEAREVLRQADAAIVASGTATLEASLMHCPAIVTYKVSPLTWTIGKALVKLDFVSLVNIIANREVYPELLQSRSNPAALAEAIIPLLSETEKRQRMLEEISQVNDALGAPGASKRAASAVIEVATSPRPQDEGKSS